VLGLQTELSGSCVRVTQASKNVYMENKCGHEGHGYANQIMFYCFTTLSMVSSCANPTNDGVETQRVRYRKWPGGKSDLLWIFMQRNTPLYKGTFEYVDW
jgi:hypothetical protein